MGIPACHSLHGSARRPALRLAQPADFYYLLMGFAVVAQRRSISSSARGLARMRAIKWNEPLAQSQGINPLSYKLLAIALSALLAGSVADLVFYLTIVDPSIFDFYYTETMLNHGDHRRAGQLLERAGSQRRVQRAPHRSPTCWLHDRSAHGAVRRRPDRGHAAFSRRVAGWLRAGG